MYDHKQQVKKSHVYVKSVYWSKSSVIYSILLTWTKQQKKNRKSLTALQLN